MNRRARVLEALGLTPLWVRREVAAMARMPKPVSAPTRQPICGATKADAAPETDRESRIRNLDWPGLKIATAQCTACALHKSRKQAVLGTGDPHAQWLFVGEGPGAEEDARGEPFVGQAGKLLDNMLSAIQLRRGENVYIANVLKCRPPGNRTPEPGEANACEPFLARQIELIRPKLIVALGKVAANNLLVTDATLGSLRGRVHDYRGTPLIVTYHPAYLLRNLVDKAKAWEDLCFAVETMRRLNAAKDTPYASSAGVS